MSGVIRRRVTNGFDIANGLANVWKVVGSSVSIVVSNERTVDAIRFNSMVHDMSHKLLVKVVASIKNVRNLYQLRIV